jgi:3-phosphoshikimate 1-carboxyvinyltransferase
MTSALPALLPIKPFTRPVQGHVTLPGSKSITNRALLLAALSPGITRLEGALFSEDTQLMAAALRTLGGLVETDESSAVMTVRGLDWARLPARAEIHVGLAGTAARFLVALLAAAPQGTFRVSGVPQMHRRPMRGLIEALRALGADIRCLGDEGFLPVEIHARGLTGAAVELDASESSQLLSALLMVAPLAAGPVTIQLTGKVRQAYVTMSRRMMAAFGQRGEPETTGCLFKLQPAPYRSPGTYAIEPDASAASYFLALPLVTDGGLDLPGLPGPGQGLQGDTAFADLLARVRDRAPGAVIDEDFHAISDTFLTLAALSPLLGSTMRLRGLAHTRRQETDRVAGMARELTKLGQGVIEEEDRLTITPAPLPATVEIETYHDHRFAMSFAILGCHNRHGDGRPWLTLRDPGCCAKTFPHFFTLLDRLRRESFPV